ncbi:MAG: hypothetical protein ACRD8Z_03820 [Nitrososphaeraceae archaeon]
MPSLMDMEKKSVIIVGIIGNTVGLFLLVTAAVAVSSVSASNNCIDIDCLRQKLERICKDGTAPSYLDCENILRCIDAGEQEIMRECARGYSLVENEIRIYNSPNLLYRS